MTFGGLGVPLRRGLGLRGVPGGEGDGDLEGGGGLTRLSGDGVFSLCQLGEIVNGGSFWNSDGDVGLVLPTRVPSIPVSED